jgi:hypothetical protein
MDAVAGEIHSYIYPKMYIICKEPGAGICQAWCVSAYINLESKLDSKSFSEGNSKPLVDPFNSYGATLLL